MTRNQIEYLKVKMDERELQEAVRHNLINESLSARVQSEAERHNLEVERQALMSISVSRLQAQASMASAGAAMASAGAAAANAAANQKRADLEEQLLPYQQYTEWQKAQMYGAQADLFGSQTTGQDISNAWGNLREGESIDLMKAQQEKLTQDKLHSQWSEGFQKWSTEFAAENAIEIAQLGLAGSIGAATINGLGGIGREYAKADASQFYAPRN